MNAADDAFKKWFGPNHRFGSDYAREAFKAGYRRALEDAADECDWPKGAWFDAARWLRKRAAAVGDQPALCNEPMDGDAVCIRHKGHPGGHYRAAAVGEGDKR
jgi:hypothetical protein